MTYRTYGKLRPRLKKVARTWEIIIAILVFIFLLYRVAVAYEWIPPDYTPGNLIVREYREFKGLLNDHIRDKTVWGKTSKMTLGVLQDMEKYIEKKKQEAKMREEMSKRCQENEIFRFFMKWGEEDSSCVESKLKQKSSEKDTSADTNALQPKQ